MAVAGVSVLVGYHGVDGATGLSILEKLGLTAITGVLGAWKFLR
jgi:hypothetical protein